MIRKTLAVLAVMTPAAAFAPAAFAHDGLTIRDAYVRSTNPQTAAAFMVVENHQDMDCPLGGVTSDAASKVELHTHSEQDGVMRMHKIDGPIVIPAGADHALARGGDHVMLMGLNAPLADGDTVALTLDFGPCGTREVEAPMDNDRAPDAASAHTGH